MDTQRSPSALFPPLPVRPDVAIVVPVHNALEYTRQTLHAIAITYPRVPLIVVDDGSNEVTCRWLADFVRERHPGRVAGHCVLLRNERQQLFTRTVNRGLRWAYNLRHGNDPLRIDFVAVVNSDCDLWDGWLKALRLGMEDARAGIVGFAEAPDGWEPAYRELREPAYISGHCFLVRVRMLEEIGVLCETDTYGGPDSPDHTRWLGQAHVSSDRALSWRANRAGWRTLYCHCRLCAHAGAQSWHRDLEWLARFDLQPLWPPCDALVHPSWREEGEG
jgi:cellulose synthase/poly-beta-1,6-N-acetylglucosamine synthase-like glycosyltransferase